MTLISLGLWQLNRLTWKTDIINQLEAIYAKDATSSFYQFNDLKAAIEQEDITILYGSLRGRFDYNKEILAGPKTFNKQISYQVITPLKLNKGGHVLVSRGYITVGNKDKIEQTHRSGNITVSGLIRQPDWTKFTPKNNPENNVWSRLDINEIASAKNIQKVAPVMMYAETISAEVPHLTLQEEKWTPRNKHKQYALFWFTMAGIMIGLFGYFAYTRAKY